MKSICIALLSGAVGCALAAQFPAAAVARTKEKVLHSFGSGTDGEFPMASLIDVKGALYGTTYNGGAYGFGTAFSLNQSTGAETVLYSFCSQRHCRDGEFPGASLIDVKGTLYGTTEQGGANCKNGGCGTVFALNPTTGAETVLHSFGSGTDGEYPESSLIDVKGTLYGTTAYGGTGCTNNNPPGCGTVFALDQSTGVETVLYSFCSQPHCTDGANPVASVIDVNGTLYGTTEAGGTGSCINGFGRGCGTVFSIDSATGAEKVIYAFQSNGADGNNPEAGLINVNGTLYGTTYEGGSGNDLFCVGCGTVFSLNPNTGAEKVLYSFCNQNNCSFGSSPAAGLIDVNGTLYGTTSEGGFGSNGAVFALDPSTGAETLVYSFCAQQNCTDGEYPIARLIDVSGTLYGTTYEGGTYGDGTLFAITKP